MVLAILQTALFYLFVRQFPDANWIKANKPLAYYAGFTILSSCIAGSPYMFKAALTTGGRTHIAVGWGLSVFIAFIAYSIIAAFRILLREYALAIGMKKVQLFVLLMAATLNWVIIPLTNFVLTLLLKTTIFVAISPLYSLLFASVIGYALVRHYLFDFRRMLTDSVIYIDYHLKDARRRAVQYYELQTLIYRARTNHVALDFSGVKGLDSSSLTLLKSLNIHVNKQGKRLYFTGLTKNVFEQLKLAKILKLSR